MVTDMVTDIVTDIVTFSVSSSVTSFVTIQSKSDSAGADITLKSHVISCDFLPLIHHVETITDGFR